MSAFRQHKSCPGVPTHWMSLQAEEEEQEDLQELMGHFRGMQVHLKNLHPGWCRGTCQVELFDNTFCWALPWQVPMQLPCTAPAWRMSVHGIMSAELLTGCKQPQSLCCGLQMHQEVDKPGREPVLASFDLEGIADYIRSGEQSPQDASSAVLLAAMYGHVTLLLMAAGNARRIVCMCGAGISVSAGGSTLQHACSCDGCRVTLHLLMLVPVQPPSEESF